MCLLQEGQAVTHNKASAGPTPVGDSQFQEQPQQDVQKAVVPVQRPSQNPKRASAQRAGTHFVESGSWLLFEVMDTGVWCVCV